jgi:anti-sigma factor RsiW
MRRSRRKVTPLPAEPSCEQVGAVLQAYLDGELSAGDTGLVVEHLEHCERCRIEADTMQRVIAAIQRQRPELAPEVLHRLTAVVDNLAPPDDDLDPLQDDLAPPPEDKHGR